MTRRSIPLLVSAALLGACTMIPKYTRPAAPVPASWPPVTAAEPELEPPLPPNLPWREFFTDARVRSVIETALANNRDLRIAALNVERVQSLYRIQRAELYPTVGIQALGDRYRVSENGPSGRGETVDQYSVQVGLVSWELDLFGRIRSLNAAALERYFATEQGRDAARVALVAGTGRAYLALAADVENLQLARATFESQRSYADLIHQSADAGIASDLDLYQAQSQVETARADIARFKGLAAVDRHALDLLAGAPISAELLPDGLGAVTGPGALAPGLPSEVLLRRPDILAAEHLLRAMNANIGAARAEFFPRISLTAGAGTLSSSLSSLFGAGTGTWTFSTQILAPIFASGSLRANLNVAEVDREIAVAHYERAIQVAFAEVSDGLTLRSTLVEQRDAQEALVRALEEAYRLSDARYEAGIDGYLGVLIAERSLLVARHALIAVRLAEQANLVTLYQSLGGDATGRDAPPR
jgi:outer membrane protein, multidrug efflux system